VKRRYKERRGWGIVKPVMDLKAIAPLCKHPYHGHPKGCSFCRKKRFYWDVMDKDRPIWALYFSMNLEPMWSRLRKKWPNWTEAQVQNEFLEEHPGPWIRALNRAPGHITYTFGIHYNHTMEQIGVRLQWPPEPHPLTIQFLGRPLPGVDYSWAKFILDKDYDQDFTTTIQRRK
jgi:hypothetical protein